VIVAAVETDFGLGLSSICRDELDVDGGGNIVIRRYYDLWVIPFGQPPIAYGVPCGSGSPRTPVFTTFPEVAFECRYEIRSADILPGAFRVLADLSTTTSLGPGFRFRSLRGGPGPLVSNGWTSMIALAREGGDDLLVRRGDTVEDLGPISYLTGPLGVLGRQVVFSDGTGLLTVDEEGIVRSLVYVKCFWEFQDSSP
jgi:hypothetical protein